MLLKLIKSVFDTKVLFEQIKVIVVHLYVRGTKLCVQNTNSYVRDTKSYIVHMNARVSTSYLDDLKGNSFGSRIQDRFLSHLTQNIIKNEPTNVDENKICLF